MKNYHFRTGEFNKRAPAELFVLLIALIEIEYQARVFRAGYTKAELTPHGICDNVVHSQAKPTDFNLSELFFKYKKYPILPYALHQQFGVPLSDEIRKTHRWGKNVIGNKRMALLARMIKDLTHYLTHKA